MKGVKVERKRELRKAGLYINLSEADDQPRQQAIHFEEDGQRPGEYGSEAAIKDHAWCLKAWE